MNMKSIVRIYTLKIRPRAQEELDYFRHLPSLASAIERAALAINSCGKRYGHQRRLQKKTLERAEQALVQSANEIEMAKDFDALFKLIEVKLQSIKGIGELYVYDTALRIGAKLNFLPAKVYLHAGTRQGAKALGFDGKLTALTTSDLPTDLKSLKPHEIEDVLCIFKDDFQRGSTRVGEEVMAKRSWCA